MKHLFFAVLSFFITACQGQESTDSKNKELVLLHVNVIPMDKETVLEDYTVVIEDGLIKTIGKSSAITYSKDAMLIDAKGKYLIPGLAEMHAHVPPVEDIAPMKEVLLLFACNGVTTIRGMLGHPKHIELRSKIESGEIFGPRFITSGPSFSGNSLRNPEQAAQMVRDEKKMGYDFLKLHPGITLDNFNAIVKTAREVNIPFAGHVSNDVGVWRAIDAGYASIDHMDGFVESLVPDLDKIPESERGLFGLFIGNKADTSRIPKLMHALKEKNVWVVPTQCLAVRWMGSSQTTDELLKEPEMVYMSKETLNNWANAKNNIMSNAKYNKEAAQKFIALRNQLILACQKNGVGLLLGSDAPQVFDVPGFSLYHELQYMVDAGLTPYEALRSGTVNPGIFFKNDKLGIIKTGAIADLVLLNGNPLKDITQVKNIEAVFLNGRLFSKEEIKKTLLQLKKE
jgi:imidazolonepropionase-like amidohydrolase